MSKAYAQQAASSPPTPLAGEAATLSWLEALAELPSRVLEPHELQLLTAALGSDSKRLQRRAADAAAALAPRNPALAPRLGEMLMARAPKARWGAVYALGRIDGALDLRGVPALCEALAGPDGDVRWATLELLARLGREHPAPIRRAMLALFAGGAPQAQKMALYCMRRLCLNDPEVFQALKCAIRGTDVHVRLAALSMLRNPGWPPAASELALERLRTDPEPGVRRAAASTLGHLGSDSAAVLSALSVARSSPDPGLSKAAAQSLGRLEGK